MSKTIDTMTLLRSVDQVTGQVEDFCVGDIVTIVYRYTHGDEVERMGVSGRLLAIHSSTIKLDTSELYTSIERTFDLADIEDVTLIEPGEMNRELRDPLSEGQSAIVVPADCDLAELADIIDGHPEGVLIRIAACGEAGFDFDDLEVMDEEEDEDDGD